MRLDLLFCLLVLRLTGSNYSDFFKLTHRDADNLKLLNLLAHVCILQLMPLIVTSSLLEGVFATLKRVQVLTNEVVQPGLK